MKKKVVAISILAVFMIVAISYATAINTSNTEKKESPLYRIRTRNAIGEKLTNIIEKIKIKFLGERNFFVPFFWLEERYSSPYPNSQKERTGIFYDTCDHPHTCALPYCDPPDW